MESATDILRRLAAAFDQVLGPLPLQQSHADSRTNPFENGDNVYDDDCDDDYDDDHAYDGDDVAVGQHYLGTMSVTCLFCRARFFEKEPKHCCRSGNVSLPDWRQPPDYLKSLLSIEAFRNRIRGYNCALSLGSSVFTDMTAKAGGPAAFKMCGRSWRLLPKEVDRGTVPAKTAQVYVLEGN
jgi:hypothetical protein